MPEAKRTPPQDQQRARHPWRVEGSRQPAGSGAGGQPAQKPLRGIWWLFLVLLAINWIVAASVPSSAPATLSVPYSVFRTQVQQRNVASVTATGETIQGTFRRAVSYPPGKSAHSSTAFKTER